MFCITELAIFSLTFTAKLFTVTLITPPRVLQPVPNLSYFIYFHHWQLRKMVGGGRINPTAHKTLPKCIWDLSAFLQKVWFAFSLIASDKVLQINVSRAQNEGKFTEISAFPMTHSWSNSLISVNISQLLFPGTNQEIANQTFWSLHSVVSCLLHIHMQWWLKGE